jgi:hypothetical protein
MKTFLTLLSFVSALAVPGALAIEVAGFSLPTAIDPTHAFAGFVVSLVALMAFADYAKTATRRVRSTAMATARTAKAAHPLAA